MAHSISRALRLAAGLAAVAGILLAHHSFGAEYDSTKPVTITGVITKIEWTNPHSYFFLDVKDADGKLVLKTVETIVENNQDRFSQQCPMK